MRPSRPQTDEMDPINSTNPALTQVVADYFGDKKEVVAVYLFGSQALGRERPTSDVDLGILYDDDALPDTADKRDQYMVALSRHLKKDIHPVILNSAGEGLMKQVFSRGKCILVNNPEKHSQFRTFMFSKIADFAYLKDRMQAGLAKKIMECCDGL